MTNPELIDRQLSLEQEITLDLGGEAATTLKPVRYVPSLQDETSRLPLDGAWSMVKWPFKKNEAALAAPALSTATWAKVSQPGPVFLYDPEQNPATVKDWDRVSLAHLDPEDGALLRRTASLPSAWAGRRIYLRFDAIYPAARIYLDGALLGEHLSGLTPVEFDVTDRVQPGRDAVVAVRLLRKHPFVRLDMPRHAMEFAGISQSACFFTTGDVQIRDLHLVPQLDASCRRGMLAGAVELRNFRSKAVSAVLTVTLTDGEGRTAGRRLKKIRLEAGAEAAVPVRLALHRPRLWNDEFPHLYTVSLHLTVGKSTSAVTYRTGFRRLDLGVKGARLNGRPVKFRGVNHLTFHPQSGLHTPKDWLRRNLALMKKANVNAIRTHFLSPPDLVDLCDEMGFYLLQELPIDWGTNYIHDKAWVGPILMRLAGGVRRDRHHPALMVWAIGNENMPETKTVAADGWNHLRLFDQFVKTLDPSRPTMFPPPGPANKVEAILELRVGDIADTHYSFKAIRKLQDTGRVSSPWAWDGTMEDITREQALKRGWKGVWFSSEYGIFNLMPDLLNAPYQSIISDVKDDLYSGKNTQQTFIDRHRREWGMMRKDPTCLGGAYFPWLCAGAGRGPEGNPWGWVRWGEDADWGVVTADLCPKPEFWALRVLFAPVAFSHDRVLWKKGQKQIRIELWNQYNAIDLCDCTLRTMMGGGGPWMGMMREWRDVPMRCPPGQKRVVTIPIWNPGSLSTLEKGLPICCRCFLLDPKGFRPITHDVLVIPEDASEAVAAMPIGPDAVFEKL